MSVDFYVLSLFFFSEQPEPLPRRGRAAVPPPEPREQAPRSHDASDSRDAPRDVPRDAPRDAPAQEQAAVCVSHTLSVATCYCSFIAPKGTKCGMDLVSR